MRQSRLARNMPQKGIVCDVLCFRCLTMAMVSTSKRQHITQTQLQHTNQNTANNFNQVDSFDFSNFSSLFICFITITLFNHRLKCGGFVDRSLVEIDRYTHNGAIISMCCLVLYLYHLFCG